MSNPADLSSLLDDSGLDETAVSAMQLTADTMGPAIQAAMGDVGIDDIDTAEAVLVTFVVDDSYSIESAGNTQLVRDGHNGVLAALKDAKQAASVLVSCTCLNAGLVYPYRPLDGADELTGSNYNPYNGTPLYQRTAEVLTTVAAKVAEFEAGGVAVRAITAIISDGADNGGPRSQNANAIKTMVDGLLRTESHIVIGLGIDDGYTDFRTVFEGMGIRDEWVLLSGNTPSEIRRAFAVVSQSAVRASQAAGGTFSQFAMGGFGGAA